MAKVVHSKPATACSIKKQIQCVVFVFMLLCMTTTLEAQIFQWAKTMGGPDYDYGNAMTIDDNRNIYTTGFFIDSGDFDPGPGIYNLYSASGGGYFEAFVSKLDSSGNFVWAKSVGGLGDDQGTSIAVDHEGNVYIVGNFTDTADFDPGPAIHNLISPGQSMFILKLDSGGNFIWAKSFQSIYGGIKLDAWGNIYLTGDFFGTVDFDLGPGVYNLTSHGSNDIFISKLDSGANLIWAYNIGGIDYDGIGSFAIDYFGNVYLTGGFQDTVDFDPGVGIYNLTSAGSGDIFVSKLDSGGNFIWARNMVGIDQSSGLDISVDNFGNVITIGRFQGTVDFDPGLGTFYLTSYVSNNIFISKLNSSGNFVWAKRIGGAYNNVATSNTVDSSGNIYVVGYFDDTLDFDPGSGTYNLIPCGDEVFILKLNANGNFMWAKNTCGNYNFGYAITLDGDRNVYVSGFITDNTDFDPPLGNIITTNGIEDIFVAKYSQCFSIPSTQIITACNSYKWIDGNTYTANNNSATYSLISASACDSVITLNLTINNIDTSVTQSGITLTANATGITYQWLDCDNGYAAISGETSQSYTASVDGNYAVEVIENGCTDTSSCYNIAGVGILENTFETNCIIYPNPTNGYFTIDLGERLPEAEVIITNVLGQEVSNQQYTNASALNVYIEGEGGLYFARIKSGNKTYNFKIIKQ